MISHVLVGEIQQHLMTPLGMTLSRHSDCPLRMSPVEITVLVHHLRLDPYTKVKSKCIYLVSKLLYSTRKLAPVLLPVSK